ncbi:MAG TPA: exodeoxyribonuclease V subunit alpha [Candidatus Binataceae bacterium]
MKPRYARLGMETASRRFDAQSDAPVGPTRFERRMRALEANSGAFNLDRDAVHAAAEIAALEPALDDERRFALIVLIVISLAALTEGSTRFPVTGEMAREPMRRMLSGLLGDAPGEDGADAMAAAIENLLESSAADAVIGRRGDDYKPILYMRPFIYHQRIHDAEAKLAERLKSLANPEDAEPIDGDEVKRALADVIARPSVAGGRAMELSSEQRDAVAAAARSHLTVISGGPGTGKTTIVVAILRVLARLGVRPGQFALAAPTGKAAYRMGECVRDGLVQVAARGAADEALLAACPAPSTLHRLLGYSPASGRFRHHRNNCLAASVVIVDEGSMLDLALMERLAGAVRPGARLVVLGDANQLPSVAAGAVFRELAPREQSGSDARATPAGAGVRLIRNYRTESERAAGGAIEAAARAINAGDASVMNFDMVGDAPSTSTSISISNAIALRASAAELRFEGVEFVRIETARGLGPFLDRWYAEQIAGGNENEIAELAGRVYIETRDGFGAADRECLRRLFAHRARSRILCVTRVFDTGAETINERLHRRAAARAGEPERNSFLVGEPLMVLRNDYDRMLFNGDQGLLLWVRRGEGNREAAMAVFPRGGGFAVFPLDALTDMVELCYASTVHKAQGSEFDAVAIVLPEKDLPILTREILYTAVTRSRNSVVMLGTEELARAAIARPTERFSGLGDSLAKPVG